MNQHRILAKQTVTYETVIEAESREAAVRAARATAGTSMAPEWEVIDEGTLKVSSAEDIDEKPQKPPKNEPKGSGDTPNPTKDPLA